MFYLKADYYIKTRGLDKKDFTEEELKELEERLKSERTDREIDFYQFYNLNRG